MTLQAKDRQLAAAAATAAAVQAVQAAAPLPAAASPAPAGTPMAPSNAAANTMQNMLQKLQASAPGACGPTTQSAEYEVSVRPIGKLSRLWYALQL